MSCLATKLVSPPTSCRGTWATLSCLVLFTCIPVNGSSNRVTPIVRAIAQSRSAVVNIRGHKTVAPENYGDAARRVNGMGTGVVIDSRGYIITNHHVIDGVRRIQVTLDNDRVYIGRQIAHDPQTDLAIIKIDCQEKLTLIRVGTSRDLMHGEPVIAIGNAFGYGHTASRGIISALNRTVQVSDAQQYRDLIQTDASINPGNSGGPLLNIDGEMIGVNVAVRVGAQGIGFAIPVDNVMVVASRLLSAKRISGVWHGISGRSRMNGAEAVFVVEHVASGSPAEDSGIRRGDIVREIDDLKVERQLDVERALLSGHVGASLACMIERDDRPMSLTLALGGPDTTNPADDQAWQQLGLRLEPMSTEEFARLRSAIFRGGLQVVKVDPNGPAARQGVRSGDVLVGIHKWQTVSAENIKYILKQGKLNSEDQVALYYLRRQRQMVAQIPGRSLR